MFVQLTNEPDLNQALIAWKNSRPTEQDATLERMINLDLPVNEFTRVNLFIESTLLERDIIATMRNHVMWAQGSRVQDCLLFEMDYDHNPHLLAHKDEYEIVRRNMEQMAKDGIRQDEYRLELPLLSVTRYSISTDVRTILKLAAYFDELAKLNKMLEAQFFQFAICLRRAIIPTFMQAGLEPLFDMKPYDLLYKGTMAHPRVANYSGSILTVSDFLPFHLRAHIVRHRGIHFIDNLYDLLTDPDILIYNMKVSVHVQIAGTVSEMSEIISKRSCWVANYKVWGRFLREIESLMPDTLNPLPCASGKCPWDADARLRYEGNDPNPPCPIHLKLNELEPTPDQVKAMGDMVIADDRSPQFWAPRISKIS